MTTSEKRQALDVNSRTHLEMDELLSILDLAKQASVRDWTLFVVCFRHALRSAEVAELRWSDIDWASQTLTVQRKKGGMLTSQPINRMRGEPLLDEQRALKTWREEQPQQPGNDFIFTTQKSTGHIARETVSRLFRSYAEQASRVRVEQGLAPIPEACFHVHVLRHTRATIMANTRGVDIFDVKALLGHSQIASTMRYAHHDQRKACSEAERSLVEALA
jgi:integrase